MKYIWRPIIVTMVCSREFFMIFFYDIKRAPFTLGWGIWKRSILRLGVRSTLIRHENENTLQTEGFENASVSFSCGPKTIWLIGAAQRELRDFPDRVFSNTNSKRLVIVAFLNFFGAMWTEIIWCVLRVKLAPFSNFSDVVLTGLSLLGITRSSYCCWGNTWQ